uniref:uncharacterized protein LOC122583885 n=1 Tax=Erigeron canadensis TaxID=72917 RepID=UPI001CB9BAC0|nr:uncharacterized protein LOC122583885 [Erigeron canadensis]
MLEKEKFHEPWHLKTDAFSNMDNLMILQLNNVQLGGSYEDFPEEVRWLCLHGYPLKSIPSDIPMEKLVVLDMSNSRIESFAACCNSCNPQPIEGGQKKLVGSCSKDKRILPSLKILDLSFCEHLHKLGGFYELPKLERLIVRNCIRLIEICESLEECVELVHIDLSYCVKLEKLPTAIGKLKKDYKLLLDGCNESILQQLVPSAISFPSALVELSLADCNLSNESFPMDLSCLSRLKELCLDGNPIVSMPDCVRSLCSLEGLSMTHCNTLMSIERPPSTLKLLNIFGGSSSFQRVTFDPDMSPIWIVIGHSSRGWSYEIEGMVKIQPLESVEEKVLSTLGWSHLLDDLLLRQAVVYHDYRRGPHQIQIQMCYEFGIFSTIYGGQAMMPDCISWSISRQPLEISEDFEIPFTVPSSPKKKQLRGLNICYVQRKSDDPSFYLPVIKISNVTKDSSWIYQHCVGENTEINVGGGKWVTYLSHWMFGRNEMEPGDLVIITIMEDFWWVFNKPTMNCGVGFVYEDESTEEDALEYYKSWNHIIGDDLSAFQLETGEYFLSQRGFTRPSNQYPPTYQGKYASLKYKEEFVSFRAFSKRKSPKPPPNTAKRQRLSD